MTTSEERMHVLHMLQEGKIDPTAAASLLQALDQPEEGSAPVMPLEDSRSEEPERAPRWLHVRVSDSNTGKPKVNVRLPFGMVRVGMRLGARFAPEIEGMDMDELLSAMKTLGPGPFVDVTDGEDGEHVEIFLE